MTPTPADAAYLRAAADLRDAIKNGTYPPDSQLPTLAELMASYSISKETARAAIRQLADEGLVWVELGRKAGTYVLDQTVVVFPFSTYTVVSNGPGERGGPWQEACLGQGLNGDMRVMGTTREVAPDDVADILQRERGSEVIRRARNALLNGRVVQIQDAIYPDDIARGNGLEGAGRVEGGVLRLINTLDHIPKPVRIASLRLSGRLPTDEEAKVLRIHAGSVQVVERVLVDAAGRPIELLRIVAVRTIFDVDLPPDVSGR